MEGELRLPDLGARACRDVAVLLVREPEVLGVDGAVVGQRLAMANAQFGSGRGVDVQLRPADEVLAQVEYPGLEHRTRDRLRREVLDGADRLVLLGDDRDAGVLGHGCRLPRAVVEAGRVPAGEGEARVEDLALQQVGGDDRAIGGLPRSVGRDGRRAAVLVVEDQHGADGRVGAVRLSGGGDAEVAGVPALADDQAHGVVSVLDQVGHVPRPVLHELRVVGPAGAQGLVSDRLAVDARAVDAECCRVQACARHLRGRE